MSYPLVEISWPHPKGYKPKSGDCFRVALNYKYPDGSTYEETYKSDLSPEFLASGRKEVYFVHCPSRVGTLWFPVDFKASGSDSGWAVTGEFPNITVQPSINFSGYYHGWLTDGVLSDDLETRKGSS